MDVGSHLRVRMTAVCSVLLQTFPSTALSAAAHGSKRPDAAVGRAMAFIDEHLTDPIIRRISRRRRG